jgi:hypothetical protein
MIELLPRGERPQGSEDLTTWCPTCLERVVEMSNGTCGWCDMPLNGSEHELRIAPEDAPALAPRHGTTGDRRRARRVDTPVVQQATVTRLPRRRERRRNRYSDEQIIARIRLWAKLTGSPPSKADWTPSKLRRFAARAKGEVERHLRQVALYEVGDFPSETTVRERFGSLNDALVLAGFEPRAAGRPAKPENEGAAGSRPRAKVGPAALCDYYSETVAAREDRWRSTTSHSAPSVRPTRSKALSTCPR